MGDKELRQVALQAGGPNGRPESQHRHSIGSFPGQEHEGVAAFKEMSEADRQGRGGRCRFAELLVEIVEQLSNGVDILEAGGPYIVMRTFPHSSTVRVPSWRIVDQLVPRCVVQLTDARPEEGGLGQVLAHSPVFGQRRFAMEQVIEYKSCPGQRNGVRP